MDRRRRMTHQMDRAQGEAEAVDPQRSDRRDRLSPAKVALLAKLARGQAPAEATEHPRGQSSARVRVQSSAADRRIGRRTDPGPAPLSFAQQRLWFLQQMTPYKAAHNLPRSLRFAGALHVAAMRQTLDEIIGRHEVLRSRFPVTEGPPEQIVEPRFHLTLPVVDLSGLPDAVGEEEAVRLAECDAQFFFDLDHGLPHKLTLLRLGDDDHVLMMVVHHIVSDGWSFGVLMTELSTLYQAFSEGRPSPLPPLAIQYGDFSAWQRLELEGPVLDGHLDYWREQLRGAPLVLDLPIDHPRPKVASFRGGSVEFRLDPGTHKQLDRLAREHRASLFMVLLAIFEVMLLRYTGRTDLLIGTPIANRGWREVEELIGFFVNTLVVRNDLSGNPRFSDLLAAVRKVSLEAYDHQDLPFERLVDALEPDREVNRPPVVQVMFVHQNFPLPDAQFGNLELRKLRMEGGNTTRDLTMVMQADERGGMIGWLEYARDLFEPATIERMVGHFRALIDGVIADPDQRIERLPLLTDAERRQMLVAWNDTARVPPEGEGAHRRFVDWVARIDDDAVAVVSDHETLTWGQLDRRSNRLARYLRHRGVGLDQAVGICLERSSEIIVVMMAVLKAGGAYLFLDPEYPPKRLAGMVEDAGARLVVTRRRLALRFEELPAAWLLLEADAAAIAAEDASDLGQHASPDSLAYVVFTSGSTGRPKGVAVPHRQLLSYLDAVLPRLAVGPQASYATLSTFSADLGNTAIYEALTTGGCLHIVPQETATDPEGLGAYLRAHPVDCFKYVPPHLEALLSAADHPADVLPVRQLICGGDTLTWDLVRRVREGSQCGVLNHYGHTETTIGAVTFLVDYDQEVPEGHAGAMPVGRPMAGSRVYLLDRGLEPVPVGVAAELFLAGDQVSRGYIGRPRITAERFVPDPWSEHPGARMYRSGDLVKYLDDGELFFVGRVDHQVKLRGYRIELPEIEQVLDALPGVGETRAMVREDTPGAPRLVAYLTPAAGTSIESEVLRPNPLREGLREMLPEYMIPAAFVLLDRFPLTPNGKLDRSALPTPDTDRPQLDVGFAAPQTASERLIASLWSEVLGLEQVGVDDNFFDVGGSSLLLIQVYTRLRRARSDAHRESVSVSILDMVQHTTVRDLASLLDTRSPPTPVAPEATKIPSDLPSPRTPLIATLDTASGAHDPSSADETSTKTGRNAGRRRLSSRRARQRLGSES